jgi:hypothetical protein
MNISHCLEECRTRSLARAGQSGNPESEMFAKDSQRGASTASPLKNDPESSFVIQARSASECADGNPQLTRWRFGLVEYHSLE